MKVSGQIHIPAALSPKKEPPVSIGWGAEWPQSQYGRDGKKKNTCPFRKPNPGHSARKLVTKLTELHWFP
jgi:hypothetical protein